MSGLTENQILREGRRVLRKLADPKCRLEQRGDGNWAVVQRGDPQSSRTRSATPYVDAFRNRGWLEPVPHPNAALVLSDAGRAWVFGEFGVDAFAAQHRQLRLRHLRDETGEEIDVLENEAESPLSWLRSRGAIDESQFAAGERLRRDYTIARLEPRMCVDLSAPVVLGSGPGSTTMIPDAVLAAKQRFAKAMSAAAPHCPTCCSTCAARCAGSKRWSATTNGRGDPARWCSASRWTASPRIMAWRAPPQSRGCAAGPRTSPRPRNDRMHIRLAKSGADLRNL